MPEVAGQWRNIRQCRLPLALVAIIYLLDGITKHLATTYLAGEDAVISLTPFANLRYVENAGAAFSLFAQYSWAPLLLTTLTLLVCGFLSLAILYRRISNDNEINFYATILAGALGNLTDRLRQGYVVDFIDLHAGGWHWPTFNIADCAIVTGCIGLIWMVARAPKSHSAE